MTAARFLRAVCSLWGDHWQKPCLAYLASHGHSYSRQQLYNWKTGKRRVPGHIAELLKEASQTATHARHRQPVTA